MFACDCVLAAVLLTAPPDPAPPPELEHLLEVIHPALMQAALDAEVLDVREDALIERHSKDIVGDLIVLQNRYRDLLSAPVLGECNRFPDRKTINAYLTANRAYREELEARLTVDKVHAEALQIAIDETDQLHAAWSTLREARCEIYYVTVRRNALAHLRAQIGAPSYYAALMPPHLPVWHFPLWR